MALTDLATIKRFIGLCHSDTARDEQLEMFRETAEATIKAYVKRDLESQEYTEYYSGTNSQVLVLRQRPVTEVETVHQDDAGFSGFGETPFPSDSLLTAGEDYVLDVDQGSATSKSGILYRINAFWPMADRYRHPNTLSATLGPKFGNIRVVYTAGYTTIPLDLQYAVCWTVVFMSRTIKLAGLIKEEKIGDYSYELFDIYGTRREVAPEIATARQILSRYREPSFLS